MSEVMKGARRKNLEIINELNRQGVSVTPQTFSRRYKMIQSDCFKGYSANIDPTIFDIYNTVVITGEGRKKYLAQLRNNLIEKPIPFLSVLRTIGSDLFWYLRVQSVHLSKIINQLYGELSNFSLDIIDYARSMIYVLMPEAFDEENKNWITTEDFMISDPLKSVK